MIIQNWGDVVVGSLANVWVSFASFIPNLIGALIVLIIGLIVAAGLGVLVEKIFEAVRLDTFLEKLGLKPIFERAGLKLRAAYFLGRLVYWFIIVGFLLAVSDSVGLYALSGFLTSILNYLPNVIAAVLILLASLVLGHFLRRVVTASVMSAKLHAANFLGTLTRYAIWIFAFIIALGELGIAAAYMQILFTGLVAMLAIAGGLAFGLGGKEAAARSIEHLRDHVKPMN